MARKKAPEELSVEELRRLLVEKRRGARKERLEHYRRTGRVIALAPDLDVDSPPASPTIDTTESAVPAPEPLPVSPQRKFLDRFLLGVEVLAILGSVVVVARGRASRYSTARTPDSVAHPTSVSATAQSSPPATLGVMLAL